MARQGINTGSAPNDGTGDSLLVAARKINENFSELYGVVGDGTTVGSASFTQIVASGIITASSFKGDGSNLTGVTAESSGIRINNDGSLVGVAATLNFGTNLSVSPLSAGIVTISASDTGITSIFQDSTPRLGGNLDVNGKEISGTGNVNLTGVITATSFVGDGTGLTGVASTDNIITGTAATFTNVVKVGTAITLDASSGIITATSFSGDGSGLTGVASTENIITGTAATFTGGVDITGASEISVTGVITATSFDGNVSASNLNVGTVPAGRFPTTLPAVSGADLTGIVTSITAGSNISISGATGAVTITGLANTANITADSLVVSGVSTFQNVSIAGTLTYEDVTNIDSVGVITARKGVVSSGVVTATVFDGSGASLTSIPAGQLTGALPSISGANLTDLPASGVGTQGSINTSGIITATRFAGVGGSMTLGTPTDSSFITSGALNTFTSSTKIVDGIDDLNEVIFNVIKNTAVTDVDFTGDVVSGGSPLNVTLTITSSGNANRFDIDWGDGSADNGTSDSTPSHTYNQSGGANNTVVVTARNNSGVGAGHSQTITKSNFITVFTPNPGVAFSMFAAVAGGSSISNWDSGTPVYLENSTTNVAGFAVTYSLNWGDSTTEFIASNAAPGGVGGARTVHTYNNASETDTAYNVNLQLSSHPAADPSQIPTSSTNTFKVYATHTPSFTSTNIIGINTSSSSGFAVTFTNTTESTIGSFADFGNTYRWTYGDGDTDNVNVGSGAAGDTGNTIAHTFALSDNSAGTASTFATNLRAITDHSSSPFISPNVVITVEPEVRSIFTGIATIASDRTGDTNRDLYDGTDLFGRNRRVGIFTNTSHNASDYVYSYGDGSSNDTIANNGVPGGTSSPIFHTFQGSAGSKVVTLTANGTPVTIVQNGKQSSVTMTLKDVPTAPTAITASSLSMSTGSQGTSPALCANFTGNQAGSGIATGTSVRRIATTTPVVTNSISNINGSHSGNLSAQINGVGIGTTTFTTAVSETGTFNDLIVSAEGDAHDRISASTFPTGFYQVFTANISKPLNEISTGLNDFGLNLSTVGSCGFTTFVKDNLNTTPTLTAGTLSESSGGTKRFISGIPYYNTGSPSLSLTGVTVTNFTGQTFQNTSAPVDLDPATNSESTSGNVISSIDYTYANLDGASTFLSGGVPVANTGVGGAYTFGTLAVPLTSSSMRSVQTLRIRGKNPAGTGSYATNATKVQVHTAAQSGISEIAIAVSDSLGSGFTDDGVRISDFKSETTNTPSFNGSTNFYTANPYTESADPGVSGTKEATIRIGKLEHNVVDYSSGFLPVGPDRSGDTGTQYFTFAFRRQTVANFDINITSTGIAGLFIAAPGTNIDSTSGLNGWLRADQQYAGAGTPGSGVGGNGSDGCASTGADVIATSTSLSGGYTMTLGDQNMSSATGNVVLVRIALTSGQSVTALSIGEAA